MAQQGQRALSSTQSAKRGYRGDTHKEPMSISMLHQVLPASINNLPSFIGNKIYTTILDRVTRSIILTFDNYQENVLFGHADEKHISVIKYISTLYNKSNIKNKEYIIYPIVRNSPNSKRLYHELPAAEIQFICSDGFTICKVEFINTVISCDSDSRIDNSKNVKISFIGKYSYKYINPIYKIMRQKSINNSTLRESNYVFMTLSLGNQRQIYISSFDDIIMENKEKLIIEPLKKFLESKDLYDKYNVNYNLGCLLYGDPGCGKTSIFKAILGLCKKYYIDCYVYMLNITGSVENISTSINNISTSFRGSKDYINVVLMEEVDSIFPNNRNEMRDKEEVNKLNMLLQVLDGTLAPKNTIFVATTNYYDKLDKAFKRDGRFNIKVEVLPFQEEQAMEMCDKFGVGYDILKDVDYPINPTTLQKMIFFSEYK